MKGKQLHLYREATRVRRMAKWVAADCLALTGDLKIYRKIIRLHRRFIWYCGFWRYANYAEILKRFYTPVITDLFQRQTSLYNLFLEGQTNEQTGIRFSQR